LLFSNDCAKPDAEVIAMINAFSLKTWIPLVVVLALLLSGGALWAGSKTDHNKKPASEQKGNKKTPAISEQKNVKKTPVELEAKSKAYLLERYPTKIVPTGPDEMYSGRAYRPDLLSDRMHYTMPMILEARPIQEMTITAPKK
jgi:hypothetical protein